MPGPQPRGAGRCQAGSTAAPPPPLSPSGPRAEPGAELGGGGGGGE